MIKLNIAKLRSLKKVTQSELANYLGVSFQTVSKWENGVTMPDISTLPLLAKYFEVSTDQILGLKALDSDYILRTNRHGDYWNERLHYLQTSRFDMWNDDYMEFLVEKVWKITEPVSICDFGCGFGYLGMKLLPLLPKGSHYTGVDFSPAMIEEARKIFNDSDYAFNFIEKDLNEFEERDAYDIVICQTLMRHINNPREMLERMIHAAKPGGRVITIDVNRTIEVPGLYIHQHTYKPPLKSVVLQKNWDSELSNEGRDFAIGQKLPCLMTEAGLIDVDCRLNDRVTVLNGKNKDENYKRSLDSLKSSMLWDNDMNDERKEKITRFFMSRGLTKVEIDTYIDIEERAANFVNNNDASIVRAQGLFVSFGRKANA